MKLPLLLSVPHAGLRVPEEVRATCRLSEQEIVEDGDEGAAAIYALEDRVAAYATTDIARAIVDLNREESDRRPDGVVKTHTCTNVEVYREVLSSDRVEDLLARYYRPYHARLEQLTAGGVQLGIDCHTMMAVGPPIGPMAGEERPLICISDVDGTTCPGDWFAAIAESFEEAFGVEPSLNHPFRGGYITRRHGRRFPWVQLELSRAPFLPDSEKRARVLKAMELTAERLGWSG